MFITIEWNYIYFNNNFLKTTLKSYVRSMLIFQLNILKKINYTKFQRKFLLFIYNGTNLKKKEKCCI